jgi:peptide/nickel transport system permease protein
MIFAVWLGWFPIGLGVPAGVLAANVTLADKLHHLILLAIALQFASFSELFGVAVLAEQVFSYPGLGQATVEAGLRGDVPEAVRCLYQTAIRFCL